MASNDKLFNRLTILLYRLSRGRIGGSKALLLTTTGRKSGKTRTTPLRYLPHGGDYLVVASNWGKPTPPAWLYNVQANPNVTVEVKNQRFAARAEITSGAQRDALYKQFTDADKRFVSYQAGNPRIIPVIVLHPVQHE